VAAKELLAEGERAQVPEALSANANSLNYFNAYGQYKARTSFPMHTFRTDLPSSARPHNPYFVKFITKLYSAVGEKMVTWESVAKQRTVDCQLSGVKVPFMDIRFSVSFSLGANDRFACLWGKGNDYEYGERIKWTQEEELLLLEELLASLWRQEILLLS
jgi:hypothetical protein